MMGDELWRWDAARLAEAIRLGRISSREAVSASLERLAAVNGAVNAVTVVRAKEALAAADQADRDHRSGKPLGLLHGVPVTIKENVDQARYGDDEWCRRLQRSYRRNRQSSGRQLETRRLNCNRAHQYSGLQPALAYRQRIARRDP